VGNQRAIDVPPGLGDELPGYFVLAAVERGLDPRQGVVVRLSMKAFVPGAGAVRAQHLERTLTCFTNDARARHASTVALMGTDVRERYAQRLASGSAFPTVSFRAVVSNVDIDVRGRAERAGFWPLRLRTQKIQ
jgi:hypothetical protein